MPHSCTPCPVAVGLIPCPRIIAGVPVFKQDHFPDLVGRQMLLPRRHHGRPWERLTRQSDPALGDAPEHEGLLKLGQRSGIGEVGRNRVERERVQPPAVEIIPVTEMAVLEEDLSPLPERDRKSTRLNSSHGYISYAVFCL